MIPCPAARACAAALCLLAFSCADEAMSGDAAGVPPALRSLEVLGCEEGVRLGFAADLAPTSVKPDTLFVENAPGNATYDPASRTATVRPDVPFKSGEPYVTVVTDRIASADGTPLPKLLRWQFTCLDRKPPVVVGRLPLGDGVSPLAQVQVRFNEPLDVDSITAETVRLPGVSSEVTYDASLRAVVVIPRTRLYPGRTYSVVVSGKVRDAAGNQLGADVTWTFRTRAPVDDWSARLVTPAILTAAPCETAIDLRLADGFDVDFDALESAPVVIDGVPEVEVSVDRARRVVRVQPVAALRPGIEYEVRATGSLHDRAGDRPFDDGYKLATFRVVAACTEPTVSWVGEADAVVACDAALHVAFSESMEAATAGPALALRDLTLGGYDPALSPTVPVRIEFDAPTTVATLSPLLPLVHGHRYWVSVTTEARSAAGERLTAAGGWELTARCP